MENTMEIPLKTKNRATKRSSNTTSEHISRENNNSKRYTHRDVQAALFTTAKTGKQFKCPSTDEWIKEMLYIYKTNISPEKE